MAITFVGAGAIATTPNNVGTSEFLNPVPSTHANTLPGDLLIGIGVTRNNGNVGATPLQYTLLSGFRKASATVSGGGIHVYKRIADNLNDSYGQTFGTITGGTTGDSCSCVVLSYRGATDVQCGTPTVTDVAATTSWTAPSITTTVAGALVINISIKVSDTAQTSTITTFTERVDNHTTSGTGHMLAIGDFVAGAAGATATGTVTPSNTTSSRVLSATLAMSPQIPNPDVLMAPPMV